MFHNIISCLQLFCCIALGAETESKLRSACVSLQSSHSEENTPAPSQGPCVSLHCCKKMQQAPSKMQQLLKKMQQAPSKMQQLLKKIQQAPSKIQQLLKKIQ